MSDKTIEDLLDKCRKHSFRATVLAILSMIFAAASIALRWLA